MPFQCGLTVGDNHYYWCLVILFGSRADKGQPVTISPIRTKPDKLNNWPCWWAKNALPKMCRYQPPNLVIAQLLYQSCMKIPLMKTVEFPGEPLGGVHCKAAKGNATSLARKLTVLLFNKLVIQTHMDTFSTICTADQFSIVQKGMVQTNSPSVSCCPVHIFRLKQ